MEPMYSASPETRIVMRSNRGELLDERYLEAEHVWAIPSWPVERGVLFAKDFAGVGSVCSSLGESIDANVDAIRTGVGSPGGFRLP